VLSFGRAGATVRSDLEVSESEVDLDWLTPDLGLPVARGADTYFATKLDSPWSRSPFLPSSLVVAIDRWLG
jgi:hypothetical protein